VAGTIRLIDNILYYEWLDSTSDLAKRLLAEGGPGLPFAVRAGTQTRGRGRGSHAWWSDAGSLTFTVALDPVAHGLRPEQEPRLALATAVAVIDAASVPVPDVALGIRWPNDVEARGRKLGGILPERVETARGPRLLVGVGLNVLTRLTDAPAEVRRMATSLAELAAEPLEREVLAQLFHSLLRHFEDVIVRLARDDPGLAERWDRLDTLRGRWVRVDLGARAVEGWGRGIDAQGALCLDVEGEVIRLFGGQVLREMGECETQIKSK
jgi:BirA family transcriptional regulator, biotin operon repressor / biotin---[acetyl-CoA-carboxylase] ligase